MVSTRLAALASIVALALAGCGGKADEAVQELRRLKDAMCACRDRACAEQLIGQIQKTEQKYRGVTATEAQARVAAQLNEELVKCMAAAMGSGSEPPPPPLPAPPTPP